MLKMDFDPDLLFYYVWYLIIRLKGIETTVLMPL